MDTRNHPDVAALVQRGCPKSLVELEDSIKASGWTNVSLFNSLQATISDSDGFLSQTLPFIWGEAVRATDELPPMIPVLKEPGRVTLTQRQCLCILSNAFFCSFPGRTSRNCVSGSDLPSIHLDELYNGSEWVSVKKAKLHMLFNYFEQCRQRLTSGEKLDRPLHFLRRRALASAINEWLQCDRPLVLPLVHTLGQSIDDATEMLRVDFANQIIGGACIAYGCVQEEIMFCVYPELIVSRLFCPIMKADEAIILIGAERFSTSLGYAASLQYGGPYRDSSSKCDDGTLGSFVSAIDAMDLRCGDPDRQYSAQSVMREVTKAWAGFDVPESPPDVATGNWGCGAFGGDAGLKSVIQWLAASRAGKTMHYFPWSNQYVHSELPRVTKELTAKGVTVGELAAFLVQSLRPGEVYRQLREHFVIPGEPGCLTSSRIPP